MTNGAKKVQGSLPPRDNQVSKNRPVTCDNIPSPLASLRTIECTTTRLRGRFCVGGQDLSPRYTRDIFPRARVDTVQFFYYAGLGICFKKSFLSADISMLLHDSRQSARCTTACLRYGRLTGKFLVPLNQQRLVTGDRARLWKPATSQTLTLAASCVL